MDLRTALEIGKECGLETIGEAVANIKLHVLNIFVYDEINQELEELSSDLNKYNVDHKDSIDLWLGRLK